MASTESQVEKIQKHFQALSGIASSLNTASDELTKAVGVLDEALKKLNIGLSVWVIFRDRSDQSMPGVYDYDEIGYCKVNGTWGIALRTVWGDSELDRHESEGPWLFTDAPRGKRIQAVDKIPSLIEALSKQASETQKKIEEKTKQVRSLADAIRVTKIKKDAIELEGISPEQFVAITEAVARQQTFVGELIMHSHRLELGGRTMRVYFHAEKRAFAEMLEGRDAVAKMHSAVQQVLGIPVQIVVHTVDQNGKGQK